MQRVGLVHGERAQVEGDDRRLPGVRRLRALSGVRRIRSPGEFLGVEPLRRRPLSGDGALADLSCVQAASSRGIEFMVASRPGESVPFEVRRNLSHDA